FSAGLGRSGPV
ncbi:hypothetical protein CPC698_1493B, partial [Chlamydia psittaci C6/98]